MYKLLFKINIYVYFCILIHSFYWKFLVFIYYVLITYQNIHTNLRIVVRILFLYFEMSKKLCLREKERDFWEFWFLKFIKLKFKTKLSVNNASLHSLILYFYNRFENILISLFKFVMLYLIKLLFLFILFTVTYYELSFI